MKERPRYVIRLTQAATADFEEILRWTVGRFGTDQARDYAETLKRAIAALVDGPETPGARRRDEVGHGIWTMHVARGSRKGRHFVLFRLGRDGKLPTVEVLRLLHDAMDLRRHAPAAADNDGIETTRRLRKTRKAAEGKPNKR